MCKLLLVAIVANTILIVSSTDIGCNGDPNAVPGCGNPCGHQCSDFNRTVICPRNCVKDGCDCKKGFVIDDTTRKCICPKDCPPICKDPNEVFDRCPPLCPPQRCDVDPAVITCEVNPKPGDPRCKPGCRCRDGYVRNDKGICIPREQCPKKCTRPNEVWDCCPPNCPPQTCESIWTKYPCPLETESRVCKGRCVCKPGFFRNLIGECITKEQCLRCRGPHEFFSCGGACDNVCATLSQQNQTNCPIINIKCNEMCYCEKDFARANNGTCVPIESCRRCKGKHEYFDCIPPCFNEDCCKKPRLCDVATADRSCCNARCRCEDNFCRDRRGECVRKEDCDCS